MVFTPPEMAILIGNFKKHIESLLKLHSSTPECVVWFLGGCLPFEALLHLRMFSIFGMVTRLHGGNNDSSPSLLPGLVLAPGIVHYIRKL